MVVFNVIYKCKPGKRDAFLKRIVEEGIDVACRADKGNIRYDYFIPADGSDELLLLEKWEDSETLAEHVGQPHIARLRAFKPEYVIDTESDRFEI